MTETVRLDDLELSTRAHGALTRHGILTVDELCAKSPEYLTRHVRHFGRKSLREVQEVLQYMGRYLDGDEQHIKNAIEARAVKNVFLDSEDEMPEIRRLRETTAMTVEQRLARIEKVLGL